MPTQGEIYEKFLWLQDEFDEVVCNPQAGTLSVVADPIVLEEVALGRFEVRLGWNRIEEPAAYDVIAREPHPAASSETTTHPHVQNDRLCEGDGIRDS